MKTDYRKTMYACFIGYIVQAIVNNFVPLLFVTLQSEYQIPLSKITLSLSLLAVEIFPLGLRSASFLSI